VRTEGDIPGIIIERREGAGSWGGIQERGRYLICLHERKCVKKKKKGVRTQSDIQRPNS